MAIPKPSGTPYPSMPDISINNEGVEKLLKKLNPNKACGPDSITGRVLKDLAEEISPFLTHIYSRKPLTLGTSPMTGGMLMSLHCSKRETVSRPVTTDPFY